MEVVRNIDAFFSGSIEPARRRALSAFEKQAGVRFRRYDLLNLAFCHRSYANENPDQAGNNEKLEFLGDSVLGLVVSEYLYKELSEKSEGDLAKIKSFVVSEQSLAEIAKSIRVDSFLLIGKGEENSGGREKRALLADAFEAIVGALFIDGGFKAAKKFILKQLVPEIEKVLANKHHKDYKTMLQELVQKEYRSYPRYQLLKRSGPDHAKIFWMEVVVNGHSYGPGRGTNKKEAEQAAAKAAWESLSEED